MFTKCNDCGKIICPGCTMFIYGSNDLGHLNPIPVCPDCDKTEITEICAKN